VAALERIEALRPPQIEVKRAAYPFVRPMGGVTEKLNQLRPVSFHLKTDPRGAVQYGLIAEEVAKVYPELVIRNEAGKIEGVRYDELAPMLLSEVQQQATEIRDLEKLVTEMQAGFVELRAKNQLIAQRQGGR
jgi:hypothetical protein